MGVLIYFCNAAVAEDVLAARRDKAVDGSDVVVEVLAVVAGDVLSAAAAVAAEDSDWALVIMAENDAEELFCTRDDCELVRVDPPRVVLDKRAPAGSWERLAFRRVVYSVICPSSSTMRPIGLCRTCYVQVLLAPLCIARCMPILNAPHDCGGK
jgi:hypothetical protein